MLEISKVSRGLDRKALFLWLEITDIFVIVLFCSLMNLIFGGTGLKLYFVYLPTLILGSVLIISKRGKPDGFLIHFLKFHILPKHLTCFHEGEDSFSLQKALAKKRKADKR
jgi:hypothetical protein